MTAEEDRAIGEVLDRLRSRFPHHDQDDLAEVVANVRQRFAGHPIRDYVPVLVERAAITELTARTPPAS